METSETNYEKKMYAISKEEFGERIEELKKVLEMEESESKWTTVVSKLDAVMGGLTAEGKKEKGGTWLLLRYSAKVNTENKLVLVQRPIRRIVTTVVQAAAKELIETFTTNNEGEKEDVVVLDEIEEVESDDAAMVHPLPTNQRIKPPGSFALKRPKVPVWTGVKSRENKEKEVMEFLTDMEKVLVYCNNENEKLLTWNQAFSGTAKLWYNKLKVDSKSVVKQFLKRYLGQEPLRLHRSFHGTYVRRGESWEEYLSRLESIQSLLYLCGKEIEDEEVIDAFCSNFSRASPYGERLVAYVRAKMTAGAGIDEVRDLCEDRELHSYKRKDFGSKFNKETKVEVNVVGRRRNWGGKRCYECQSEFHLSYACPKLKEGKLEEEEKKMDEEEDFPTGA